MSCLFCRHWKSPKRDWREREKDPRPWAQQIKEDIGQCTFMPEWQETAADHYCGQMSDFEIGPGEIAGMLRAAQWHDLQAALYAAAPREKLPAEFRDLSARLMRVHQSAARELRNLAGTRASDIPGHQLEALGGGGLK